MNTFRSLRERLVQPLVLLVLIAGSLGWGGIYWYSDVQLHQELQLRGRLLSDAVVFAADASGSDDELNRFVLAMAGAKDVEDVFVVDASLKHLIAGNPYGWNDKLRAAVASLGQRALDTQLPQGEVDRDDSNKYVVVTPLLIHTAKGGNALRPDRGLVFVKLDRRTALQTAIESTLMLMAVLITVVVSVLILIYRLLHRRVIGPSKLIVSTIARWKAGESAHTDLKPIDEFGVIGEALDDLVDTLKRREETLEYQQRFLKTITDALPGMVGYWNDKLRCGFANIPYQSRFGKCPEEMIGIHMRDLLGEESFLKNEPYIQAVLRGEPQHFERSFAKVDGSVGYTLAHYVPDIIDGGTRGFFVLVTEITELKETQVELERINEALKARTVEAEAANQAKSAFLAHMSHELRTPLNAILGFSDILRRAPSLAEDQKVPLAIIHRSGDHLLGLINDVLEISKIEEGHLQLEVASFDFGAMLLDVSDMMRIRALEKGLQLQIDQSTQFPQHIVGDEAKLRQILINLLSNAIKATERGGVALRLGLKHNHAEHLLIEVEDTGCGIAPEDQGRILKPFIQLESQSKQQGTGLGLAITRQFVDLMGGSLSLDSVVGQGSTFRVDLPVQLPRSEDIPQAIRERGEITGLAPGQPTWRVLVVEDQPENQLMLARLLERVGFQVGIADNGAAAVEQFQHWRPHFIWMDRRMPVMDGVESTRRIRALAGGEVVKIAAVTASTFNEEDEELLAAGFDGIVHKPFRSEQIFECMERLLGVRFERAEAETAPTPLPELSATALAALPEPLRQKLAEALVILDGDRIMAVIDEIGQTAPDLAAALKELARNYDYQPILALLRSEPSATGECEDGALRGETKA